MSVVYVCIRTCTFEYYPLSVRTHVLGTNEQVEGDDKKTEMLSERANERTNNQQQQQQQQQQQEQQQQQQFLISPPT